MIESMTTKPSTPRSQHIRGAIEPPVPKLTKPPPPTQDEERLMTSRRKLRLQELIAREGSGGAASLARKCGRTQANINHMSRPGYQFGARAARALEVELGLPHLYFDEPQVPGEVSRDVKLVPVMEWGKVGRHPPGPEAPGVATAWAVGPRAVAVVARGMMWSGEGAPGIPTGWHAIVDPDATIREGDLLCCWLPGATEATLRQYLVDGGVNYLYPVDRKQVTVAEWTRDTLIVGPVIGAQKAFR